MSEARLADAHVRLEKNKNLGLPLRGRDLLGRLALRFLWPRLVKGQVEFNLATRDAVDSLRDVQRAQQSTVDHLTAELVARLGSEVENLRRSDQNMMAGLNQRLYAAIGSIRTDLGDLRLQLVDGAGAADEVRDRLAAIEERLAALDSAALDTRLRHAQVDLFLDAAREPREQPAAVPDRSAALEIPVASLLDGPADRTRAARAAYLPLVDGGPVFDVAPGRGEWLEVLRGADVPASGASSNPFVVKHCAELGLAVAEADPLDALARTDKRSLGAITAFRYAERRDPAALARFFDLAAQSLRPGGVVVVETPNPAAPTVADFHVDPFALRPLHPTFLRFLAEAAGFARVEVRHPERGPLDGTDAAGRYTLLGWT